MDQGRSMKIGDEDRTEIENGSLDFEEQALLGDKEQNAILVGDLPFWRRPLVIVAIKNLCLILLWYFFGTFLSLWNKLLVGKEHGLFGKGAFPAPFFMSSMQFLFQHFIARLVLFTGISRRTVSAADRAKLSWKEYCKTVLPNGIATGLDIGFSNFSLVFITLSFYVMCKSTTPLFLLTFAIAWGIERPSWSLAGIVLTITTGLLLLVAGETRFDLVGFLLVMSAAALAGLRWTITQVLLQGHKSHGASGTPVEVILQLTPIMSITLMILSLAVEKLWITLPTSPYFDGIGHIFLTILIIFIGGLIAFSMVWAEYMLIANTSALTFMVAGTFKEIVTVGAAVLFLHEPFTLINALGLVVLLMGVILFNYMKYQKIRHGEIKAVPMTPHGSGEMKVSRSDLDFELNPDDDHVNNLKLDHAELDQMISKIEHGAKMRNGMNEANRLPGNDGADSEIELSVESNDRTARQLPNEYAIDYKR